jgi:hypothetical protein
LAGLRAANWPGVRGTSHATLRAYEQGRKQPGVDTFARLLRPAALPSI